MAAKDLAKRTHKKTQVENLGLLASPFGQALGALTLTQVHAGFSPFSHLNPVQRKLSDIHQPIISQ